MSAPSQVKYVRKSVSQISLPHFSPNHAAVLITAVIMEIVKVMVIDRKKNDKSIKGINIVTTVLFVIIIITEKTIKSIMLTTITISTIM